MVLLMVNFNGKMHFQNWKSVKIPLTQTINWKKIMSIIKALFLVCEN